MISFEFPKMLNTASSRLINSEKGQDVTLSNLKLFLNSEKNEFTFDPEFGIYLKKFFFRQNDTILRDLIVSEIYSGVQVFFPQITIKKQDIKIVQVKTKLICNITGVNNLDYTQVNYSLVLFNSEV